MTQFALREGTTVPQSGHNEEVTHKGVICKIRLDNLRNTIKRRPNKLEKIILEGVKKIPNFFAQLQDAQEDGRAFLEKGLSFCVKFKNRTGLTIVPKPHIEAGFDFSKWNMSVRSRKNWRIYSKNSF